jgi:phage tail sheath protein FI
MGGITGPSRPIAYYNGQTDSEANWLNQRQITTLRRGHILWGNRTCAQDPLEAFVNVVRVLDMVDEAVVNNFMWAIDKTQSVPLGTAIVQSLDSFLDELVANGAILGGRVWFERPLNSNEALASGILKISFDREPAAPLEDLQFLAGRNLTYYATLADGILQSLERQAA